jgi:serine/threonine protein kinase
MLLIVEVVIDVRGVDCFTLVRDIKGGNVLVDENGTIKLADFGASTTMTMGKTQATTTIKGTPYFMAPEVLAHSRYGRKGDVWAVGCTMIQMMTGDPPWKDRNLQGLVQLHMLLQSWNNGPPPYTCVNEVTPQAKNFLKLCFEKDETARPSAQELMQHIFLADDFDESLEDSGIKLSGENPLDESRTIVELKQKMTRAVTSQSTFVGLDFLDHGE